MKTRRFYTEMRREAIAEALREELGFTKIPLLPIYVNLGDQAIVTVSHIEYV